MLLAGALLLLALHRWGWVLLMLASGLGLLGGALAVGAGQSRAHPAGPPHRDRLYLNGHSVRDLLLRPVERTEGGPAGPAGRWPPVDLRPSLAADDLALLRAFEPIVRYNDGRAVLPGGVEGYLAECDLLQGTSERDREVRRARAAR